MTLNAWVGVGSGTFESVQTHARATNMSHLDAGTATHALPGLSNDVSSEGTALEVILLRGCLNFTEGGRGDESLIQHRPRYTERLREIPLPLWHWDEENFGTRTKNCINYITIIS